MFTSTIKFSFVAVALVAQLVSAQNALPECVNTCISSAATVVGCQATDVNCICSTSQFAYTVGNCFGSSCTIAETNAGRTAVLNLCGVGGTLASLPLGSPTSTARPSPAVAAVSTSAPTTTAPATTSASPADANASATSTSTSNAAPTMAAASRWAAGGAGLAAVIILGA